jgi:ABC-2 type transport system permease protein
VTTQSNAMPESSRDAQVNDSKAIAPTVIAATQPMYWSVRRELWENRSLYIAPLVVAAVFLFGFLIGMFRLPGKMRAALALDPMQQQALIQRPYDLAALFIMGTAFIVAVFYCLDALHGERRDRSILFWKSMPVSDLTTVLSKASIPLVVLPLIAFVITMATQWIMLMFSTVVLLGGGLSAATLWTQLPMFQMSSMLLYHLVAIHGIWYAPFYGWLLLVSAWARRAAFLWAALPLFAIGVVEKIAFNTTHFAHLLGARLGGTGGIASTAPGSNMMDPLTIFTLNKFVTSPGLWIGLAITAVFLAAAVRLRRYQGPI